MKNNISFINSKNKLIQKTFFNPSIINDIEIPKTKSDNLTFKTSYNNLKESHVIILNIINSHFNIIESIQPNKYLTQNQISLINEIREKYINYDISIYNNLAQPKLSFNPKISNNNKNFIWYNNIITNNVIPSLKNNNNSNNLCNECLNHIPNYDNEKKEKIYFDLESKNESIIKKKIFVLCTKKSNRLNNSLDKKKKLLGRKKKNSGEIGIHNKFSKDNMMRKIKNKIIESARKLINKKLKDESNSKYKIISEIRKIEGAYSQDLNIKYNYWFYFQKIKNIFLFKMSSKYSRDSLDSNYLLIKKIYSNELIKSNYAKTIQLLEMTFHQYYHDIFLGENKDWTKIFDIKEKENKFQIEYFVYDHLNKENDYSNYKNIMLKLAYNYENFFLEKNPRFTHNEKNRKTKNVKKIVKYLNNENFDIIKGKFIQQAMIYRPELKVYMNVFLSDKNRINKLDCSTLENNIFENINFYDNFNSNHDILLVKKGHIFKIEKVKTI